ncbi:MAG: NUDIX domain-containing protein [Patescibacteria group bacterium]
MIEYFDVLDEKGEKTGESVLSSDAHAQGLTHKAVHIWIINSKGELLLQKRASDKQAYPNLWDISVGGHVSAGETSLEGARREMKEELGLDLGDENFKYLFSIEQHIILNNGTYVNNEFDDVYLVILDLDLSKLPIPSEEVSGVKWVHPDEIKLMLKNKDDSIIRDDSHEEEYRQLFEYLDLNK